MPHMVQVREKSRLLPDGRRRALYAVSMMSAPHGNVTEAPLRVNSQMVRRKRIGRNDPLGTFGAEEGLDVRFGLR